MKTLTAAEVAERHNASLPPKNHNSSAKLKDYVARFQALAEQMESLRQDTRELSAEAKDHDLDPAAIKAIVKERMETEEKAAKRAAKETVIDTYKNALGMLD